MFGAAMAPAMLAQARPGKGLGLHRNYIGIMEKKMETTIMGFYRV